MNDDTKEAFIRISTMIYMLAKHIENGDIALPDIRTASVEFDDWIKTL